MSIKKAPFVIRRLCNRRLLNTLNESAYYEPPRELSNVTQAWNDLSQDTKQELNEYLNWRMQSSWSRLDIEEARAAYYIRYFGDKMGHKGSMNLGYLVGRALVSTMTIISIGVVFVNMRRDKQVINEIAELRQKIAATE